MKARCAICSRELDKDSDALSADCGGDCWGCIGKMEADMGYAPSVEAVRAEFKSGLRQDWMPAPKTKYKKYSSGSVIEILLEKPLGAPWCNEDFDFIIYEISAEKVELVRETVQLKTNDRGSVIYTVSSISPNKDLWFRISRGKNSWSYPLRNEET